MRTLWIALCLIGCGSDPDPHALGACNGWTNNDGTPFTGMCEAACKTKPTSSGMTCNTDVQNNCNAFKFGDVRGCCIAGPTEIKFAECDPLL
jgi:hypothetical protein